MDAPKLTIVPDPAKGSGEETPAGKIRRLLAEIKEAASDELEELDLAIEQLCAICDSISGGGEAFPPGIREICRGMAEDARSQAKSIDLILQRTSK